MEKEEILKGNKLIAEFMGFELSDTFSPALPPHYINKEGETLTGYIDTELKYHSRWDDWLMPVWHKFRDLRFKDETKSKLHANYVARLAQDLAYGTISELFNNIQIAIKWYNQQSINQNTEQK